MRSSGKLSRGWGSSWWGWWPWLLVICERKDSRPLPPLRGTKRTNVELARIREWNGLIFDASQAPPLLVQALSVQLLISSMSEVWAWRTYSKTPLQRRFKFFRNYLKKQCRRSVVLYAALLAIVIWLWQFSAFPFTHFMSMSLSTACGQKCCRCVGPFFSIPAQV